MPVAVLMILLATAAPALAEDEAHRADRLRTEDLNHRAAAAAGYRIAPADEKAYARARARYQQQMADWRARVSACNAGDYAACR